MGGSLVTVEVALERETPSHLTLEASVPFEFAARGSSDHFRVSQRFAKAAGICSIRANRPGRHQLRNRK